MTIKVGLSSSKKIVSFILMKALNKWWKMLSVSAFSINVCLHFLAMEKKWLDMIDKVNFKIYDVTT